MVWIKPELESLGKVLSLTKGVDVTCLPTCTLGDHASLNCYKGTGIGK